MLFCWHCERFFCFVFEFRPRIFSFGPAEGSRYAKGWHGIRKMLKAEREGIGMEHSTFLRYLLGLESIWLARRVCPVYIINYGQYITHILGTCTADLILSLFS